MSYYNSEVQQLIKSLKFGMYLRRSSKDNEDKQMRSIPGQLEDLEPVIKNNRIKLVVPPLEEKQSAFSMGRPEFSHLVELIEQGKVNAVLVWHPNRIARNYSDGGRFVQLMSDNKLKLVLTPHGLFENTARDKEYLMTEFTRATRDSDDKSEAVKRGNKTKLRVGHVPSGRLKQGFIHLKNDKGEYINAPDPERYPLLQKALKLIVNQTHTPLEALDVLNQEWGYKTRSTRRYASKSLSESSWYSILSDRKYCGEIDRSEGKFVAGFPAMIEPEEFDKIQVILGVRGRKRTKNDWTFAGELVCGECGASIINDQKWQIICPVCKLKFHKGERTDSCPGCHTRIEVMTKPKLLYYHWLRCGKTKKNHGIKCKQSSLRINKFEQQVDQLLEKIEIPKEFTDWAIAVLNDQSDREIDDRQMIEANLHKGVSEVKQKLDNLLLLKISPQNKDGVVLSEEEYINQRESLLAEKKAYERQIQKQSERQDDWMELAAKTFNFACYARYWFTHGTKTQKRAILHALGLNLKLLDKKVMLDPFKPFQIIADMKAKHADVLSKFEPNKKIDDANKNDLFAEAIPSLLPG